VWKQLSRVVGQLELRFAEAASMLDEAAPEILAFTAFPKDQWRRVWSNNPLESPRAAARCVG
jgi:putative transposase